MKKTYQKPRLVKGPALGEITAQTVCQVSPLVLCEPPA
jgi:hypothetical protein